MKETNFIIKSLVLLSKGSLFLIATTSTAIAIHLSIKLKVVETSSLNKITSLYNTVEQNQELLRQCSKENKSYIAANEELRAWINPSPKFNSYLEQVRIAIRKRNKRFGFEVKDDLLAHYTKLGL